MENLYKLPPINENGSVNVETVEIMRAVSIANRKLAELKGYAEIVPNKNILINAITLNEAKDSSEIENIITTHDELFEAMSDEKYKNSPAKEVLNYKEALWHGMDLIKERDILTTNIIVEIQSIIEGNNAGIRKQSGTVLKNERTGEVVYRPPETESEIRELMSNLELYINSDDEIDDLIKLAVIHYQFESIHPFYDGNGRTGRIINILYLVLKGLLDSPILYLSKYVMKNKTEYYKLLQNIQIESDWESWIIYMLNGIAEMSEESLDILKRINTLINETVILIKDERPKIYSWELVEVIFKEFYIRISSVENSLKVTRKTASNYLNELVELGILEVESRGREKIFINKGLLSIVKM
ncbi:MAG: Fic family protein [Acidaminobacteraceae bacterium]